MNFLVDQDVYCSIHTDWNTLSHFPLPDLFPFQTYVWLIRQSVEMEPATMVLVAIYVHATKGSRTMVTKSLAAPVRLKQHSALSTIQTRTSVWSVNRESQHVWSWMPWSLGSTFNDKAFPPSVLNCDVFDMNSQKEVKLHQKQFHHSTTWIQNVCRLILLLHCPSRNFLRQIT